MSDLNTDPYHQEIAKALWEYEHSRDLLKAAQEIADMTQERVASALERLDVAHKTLQDAIDASHPPT